MAVAVVVGSALALTVLLSHFHFHWNILYASTTTYLLIAITIAAELV